MMFRRLILLWIVGLLGLGRLSGQVGAGWPAYGGDAGGQRYSPAGQITRGNVGGLHPVWTYHTHALDSGRPGTRSAAFEATPVLFDGMLYLTTPFDRVVALDAATGTERWSYDPRISAWALEEGQLITSRGVAVWQEQEGVGTVPCRDRILLGTLTGMLLALDAKTGEACREFGKDGRVDLKEGVGYVAGDGYSVTSAPTVVGDVVVVGSSISDNYKVDVAMGSVRGFDVRTGRQLWSWDPIPWAQRQKVRTGAANAWSTIAADPALGLVYVPTGSASVDYYGGTRPGDGRDADSVVALEVKTGRRVWGFQTVHHDLWDYDVAAEPLLFTFRGTTPAVAITTKTGQVFVLDRRDGRPLYPVEERAVPQSDVKGEVSAETQPFSSLPALTPLTAPTEDRVSGWTRSAENERFCAEQVGKLRYSGIFTPPSLQGSMLFPGNLGGVNWGSPALDPGTGILYVNTNELAFGVRLIDDPVSEGRMKLLDRKNWALLGVLVLVAGCVRRRSWYPGGLFLGVAVLAALAFGVLTWAGRGVPARNMEAAMGRGVSPNLKTPYQMVREPLYDHDRNPCVKPPWGLLTAINLNTGKQVWQEPLGTMVPGFKTGSLSLGGPMVTAGGLLFTAGTREAVLRAFDAKTGEEVWQGALPVPAQSTPMTYVVGGRQFVVIAAGGHGLFRTAQGDSLIAFGL